MNGTARISLLIQQNAVISYNFYARLSKKWLLIKDFYFQVSQVGLAFQANNFFFNTANEAIQHLNSAGIMQWMIDRRVGTNLKLLDNKEPRKLTIESLSFGFIIWLGYCGLSFAVFVGEYLWSKLCRKVLKKNSFSKIKLRLNYKKLKRRNSKEKVIKPTKIRRIKVKEFKIQSTQC